MILLLCGKSGCGKDSMLRKIISDEPIQTFNGEYKFDPVVSYTTRPIREKEVNGVDYHFINKNEFMSRVSFKGEGSIAEFRSYNTLVDNKPDIWYYGSPYINLHDGKNYAAVLDIEGVRTWLDLYGKENCIVIMLDVNDKKREARAKNRGSFDQIEWDRRVADDAIKFSKKETDGVVDAILSNNGNFTNSYAKLRSLIASLLQTKDNGVVAFYGTDYHTINEDLITADGIRNLISKIPELDIKIRQQHSDVDNMDVDALLSAASSHPAISTYIIKSAQSNNISRVFSIIAFGMKTIDDLSMCVIPYVVGAALVTKPLLPWAYTDTDVDAAPCHVENVINRWLGFISKDIKQTCKYYTRPIIF